MTGKPKRKPRTQRDFDKRLAANMATLRDATTIPKAAAGLAAEMLAVVAIKRNKKLTEDDAILGSLAASLLTALSCAMPRAEFIAWLRRTAGILAAQRRKPSPPSPNKH
ncbi:MAG: hypothetical protein WA190_17690 [Usitatibacter sp.]